MPPVIQKRRIHVFMRAFLDNLIKGLILIAPIAITIGALLWVFKLVDDLLPNIIQLFLDVIFIHRKVSAPHIPGLGFVVFVLMVAGIGYFSSFFLFSKLMRIIDKQLLRTPGIKVVYAAVKDLIKTIQSNNKQFEHPVLFSTDECREVWRMGFVTMEDLKKVGFDESFVAVYVPMGFSMSGDVYMVSQNRVRVVDNKLMSAGEAMKFLISGGLIQQNQNKDGQENKKEETKV